MYMTRNVFLSIDFGREGIFQNARALPPCQGILHMPQKDAFLKIDLIISCRVFALFLNGFYVRCLGLIEWSRRFVTACVCTWPDLDFIEQLLITSSPSAKVF